MVARSLSGIQSDGQGQAVAPTIYLIDHAQSQTAIGGGPIGLELGQAFARFGSEVTIIEMDARLLPKEDEEVSVSIERRLRAEGVTILLNAKAVRAGISDGLKRITVEQNNQTSELHAEQVLVATGRQPNTEAMYHDCDIWFSFRASSGKYERRTNNYNPNVFGIIFIVE